MNLRFITSDCNCRDEPWDRETRPIPGDILHYHQEYYDDNIQAFLRFKSVLSQTQFAIHYKNQHINNVFVNGISLRRIG